MVANGGIAVAVCIVEVVWEGGGGEVVCLHHRNYHVLSGSVLGVRTHIEGVIARHSTHNPRM